MNSNDLILMIFPVLLLLIIFFKADFSALSRKGAKEIALLPDDQFPAQSKMIRAGVCVAIILHHLTQ